MDGRNHIDCKKSRKMDRSKMVNYVLGTLVSSPRFGLTLKMEKQFHCSRLRREKGDVPYASSEILGRSVSRIYR